MSPTATFITNNCTCQPKSFENQSPGETMPILISNNRKFEKKKCIFCSNDHPATSCDRVINLDERFEIIKQKKRCFNCFGNHLSRDCKSINRRRKCNRKHHTAICNPSNSSKSHDKPAVKGDHVNTVQGMLTNAPGPALLKTASVNAKNISNDLKLKYMLF